MHPMNKKDHFKLGLFSANCSGGLAVTKIEERWGATWEENLRMARIADKAGIDFLLPIARWIGYKGDTNFHGSVLSPFRGLLRCWRPLSGFPFFQPFTRPSTTRW